MSDAVLIAAVKIVGSIALMLVLLAGAGFLARRAQVSPEVSRKIIHISLGLYCLTFPWLLADKWLVTLVCALAFVLLLASRSLLKDKLGAGLHSVERRSYGELLFAISVVILYWIKDGHDYARQSANAAVSLGPTLYVLPLLILTLCDAASALVGSAYGRRRFAVESGAKSWEGVIVFATTAWLLSMIVLLVLTNLGRAEVVLISLIVAIFGAMLEATSWKGLDNLFIPIGLQIILQHMALSGLTALILAAASFFIVLVATFVIAHRRPRHRHFIISTAILFLLIASFASLPSVLAPALVLAAYGYAMPFLGAERPPYDSLNLLLAIIAISIGYFCVSHFAQIDTIFAFNASLCAFSVGVLTRCRTPPVIIVIGLVAALFVLSFRTVAMEGVRDETMLFMAAGGGVMVLVGAIGATLRGEQRISPWITLGALSFVAGLALLPLSP